MDDDNETPRIRGVASAVQQAAVRLRDEMTPAESRLWQELRARRLDGGVHDGQAEQDAARTAHLVAYGYRVLRFSNEDVMTDLPGVLARIQAAAGERTDKAEAPPSP